jgi:hypothetical protein
MLLASVTCQDDEKNVSVKEENLEKEREFGDCYVHSFCKENKVQVILEPPLYIRNDKTGFESCTQLFQTLTADDDKTFDLIQNENIA